ncbi:hypothetical protein SAMN05216387_10160 [Nitrosovibrio tenuis]|uniref:Uncharacterized protein n=1 Tax=Nitrosovibrio tenuis TaxID=1233 RepID=A0A1H7FQR9_9PROT|nr:hypothetical protein SAMN05216387_10160 [Nitrosovibrio tenuis]
MVITQTSSRMEFDHSYPRLLNLAHPVLQSYRRTSVELAQRFCRQFMHNHG